MKSNVIVEIHKTIGDSVRAHGCMGLIGIYADDFEELIATLQQVNNEVKVLGNL